MNVVGAENPGVEEPDTAGRRRALEIEVGELLTDLGERLRRRARDLAEDGEVKLPEVSLLHVLKTGPARMGDLAGELGYDASHITALVDRLESLGYVQRQGDPHDRRVKRIVLTTAGRRRIRSFEQRLFGGSDLLEALEPAELRQLAELLHRAAH